MSRVLIFGAGGFVGSYLCKEFLNNGYKVSGTDKGEGSALPSEVDFYKTDLMQADEVKKLIGQIQPDIIVNLAAISSVGASWNMPQTTMAINVIGALNIMEAARKSEQKSNHWIEAHIHAYSFFGGVTRILVPDNLKTGVIKNTRTELILNRSYHEMAEHYGTAIIPARPVRPKDKPNAEGTVKVLETWILAALRNRKFFTFQELNKAIHEKLKEFNAKPFQKKKGSRLSAFIEEEKDFLMPLPASPYETDVWSTATIQPDYLITVGDCRYSVPYEFIGKKVDIRTTENSIEIFYHNQRIASHVRKMYSAEPVYIPEHMPENHRRFLEYNTESFLDWGKDMGYSTLLVVKHFLYMHKVEQQGYKACASLMKLADRYGTERLENACAKALSYTPSPSLKNISTILKNGQDKVALTTDPVRASSKESSKYGITRGASYYGGGDRS